MNDFVLQLPWPARSLSPNARVHWRVRAKFVEAARSEAYLLSRAGAPAGWSLPPNPLLISIFHPPRPVALNDIDNLQASLKPAIDGMCQALGFNDRKLRAMLQLWGETAPYGAVVLRITDASLVHTALEAKC